MEDTEEFSSCSSSARFYTSPNSPAHTEFDFIGDNNNNDQPAILLPQDIFSLPKLGTWDLGPFSSATDFPSSFEKENSVKKTDLRSNASLKDANSIKHDQAPKVAPVETEYFVVATKSKTSPHNRKLDALKRFFRLGGFRKSSGDKKEPLRLAIPTKDQPLPNENNPILAEKKTDGNSNSTQIDENSSFKQGIDAGKFQFVTNQSKNSGKPSTFSKIFRLEGIRKLWSGKKSNLALPEPTVSVSLKQDDQPPPVVVVEQEKIVNLESKDANSFRRRSDAGNHSALSHSNSVKRSEAKHSSHPQRQPESNDVNSFRKRSDAGYHSLLGHSNSVKRLEAKLSSHSQHQPDNQLVTHVSKKYKGKLSFLQKIIKPGRFGKYWKGSSSGLVSEGQEEDKPVPKFDGFGDNGPASIQNTLSVSFENIRDVRNDEDRKDSTELVTIRSDRGSKEWIRSARKSTDLRLSISRSMRSFDLLGCS